MNYNRYEFQARIELYNISGKELQELKGFCSSLFKEQQEKRRSCKHWTGFKLTHFIPDNPLDLRSTLLFEISNANSVRVLKTIEGTLNSVSNLKFSRVIKNITCAHQKLN